MRDDSAVYSGYRVPNFYDPMISKLSVWAPTRMEAILKMRRALDEYVLTGITTNLRYLNQIVSHAEFVKGDYDTGFLGREHQKLLGEEDPALTRFSMIAAAVRAHQRAEKQQATIDSAQKTGGATGSSWRSAGRRHGSWKRGA